MTKRISSSAIKQHIRSSAVSSERLHVAPKGSAWSVRKEGSSKGRNFSTKVTAVEYAKERTSNKSTNVVIHKRDGRIEKWK